VTATAAWQALPDTWYTTKQSGGSLEAFVLVTGASSGDSFEADGLSLAAGTPPRDTTPPDSSIDSGPSGTVSDASATFVFSSTESGSTFECRLDGTAWASCTSPASYSGLAAAAHSFDVRATDAAGNTDATPAGRSWTIQSAAPAPPSDGNLLLNGDFENGVDGWSSWQGTLTAASDGTAGPGAAKVTLASANAFSLIRWPRPVLSTGAGTAYTADGWMRSDTPGKEICLIVREWSAAGLEVSTARQCVVATAAWQRFPRVSYTVGQSGGSLEAFVLQPSAAAGDSFEIDGLRLAQA
jgi:hypothetical protein